MNKTTSNVIKLSDRLTVNTERLAEILDCGKVTAVKIGDDAGARIRLGKRVLWNVSKIEKYLDSISIDKSVGGVIDEL